MDRFYHRNDAMRARLHHPVYLGHAGSGTNEALETSQNLANW